MNKIDCSNIFNFINEWQRRMKSDKNKSGSAKWDVFDFLKEWGQNESAMREEIAILQDWSNRNPPITRREKFEKICRENGFNDFVDYYQKDYCDNFSEKAVICFKDCEECIKYWNEIVIE